MYGFQPRKSASPSTNQEKKQGETGGRPMSAKGFKPRMPTPPVELGSGAASKVASQILNRKAQLEEAANYANGGVVRGRGTGTSDDIETEVPQGTYIMPADSTKEIGEEALAQAGSVPVNLSNGEYELPPEQVHAIGVQALDQMKNATHTNVARGFKPDIKEPPEPELFFANGGVVEDERKKKAQLPSWGGEDNFAYPNDGITKGVQGALKGFDGHPGITASALGFGPNAEAAQQKAKNEFSTLANKGNYAQALGAGVRGVAAQGPAHLSDMATATGLALQPVADFGKGLFGVEDSPATATSQVATAPPTAKQPVSTVAKPSVASPVSSQSNSTGFPAGVTTHNTSVKGISRLDGVDGAPNLFTDSPQRAIADAAKSGASLNRTAAVEAQDGRLNARGFRPQQSEPATKILRDGRYVNAEDIGYTPGVTVIDSGDPRLTPGDRNFDARGFRAAMQQQQVAQRGDALIQEGTLRRNQLAEDSLQHQENLQLERDRFADERSARGFQTRSAARLEQLQQQYETAAPAERAAIAEQIRTLSGRDAPNRFTVVPGGQEIDPTTNLAVTRPSSVLNNQTGEFVQQRSVSAPAPSRAVGTTSTVNGKTAVWDGSKWVPR